MASKNVNGCRLVAVTSDRTRRTDVEVVMRALPVLDRGPEPAADAASSCCVPLLDEVIGVDDAAVLARRFAALADPVRLRLLSLLATSPEGGVCACDLVEPAGRSQPTVSHHLKILREAGLVTSEKRGVNIWYATVPAALDDLRDAIGSSA